MNASIVLLENDANKRGDLFSSLTQSFFSALGYEKFRLNIQRNGREIDLRGQHRTERKHVVAECKATAKPIGGADINKFAGALERERKKGKAEVVGYFISLAGFTETAVEQEQENVDDPRLILVNAARLRSELVNGRMIVSPPEAYTTAGKCAANFPGLVPDEQHDLFGHAIGFVWAIYFLENKRRTHFALIHADGQPLEASIAESVREFATSLAGLTYLAPTPAALDEETELLAIRDQYFRYLNDECGEFQLEGLPTDEEIGARKLRLEKLFVPLYLREAKEDYSTTASVGQTAAKQRRKQKSDLSNRVSAGEVLRSHNRITLLGLPGSGKSTLLKRLAIAYAFPERRAVIDDNLPDSDFLPLFIRCRQLGALIRTPVLEILASIAKRAEIDPSKHKLFQSLISSALRSGKAILLIDGLDEIAEEGDRLAFVTQLRTFLSTYQAARLVITSRQAGFRIVGSALIAVCSHFTLAEFDNADIDRLTVLWHKEIVGDRPDVIAGAKELARSICREQQIKQLAETPLLLTTLLLVRRWVRNLPTRRTTLYAKAIEVLLMTWNVEGHEPLDQEEVLPQLEYLAFTMMKEGLQQVSAEKLKEVLRAARQELPEILGYARISVADVIRRVESRSSLLILSGHDVINGVITPMYEFRHLTFQEYLAAKAIVDGAYPGHSDSDTLLSVLADYLGSEPWGEVILSACILSGRKATPVVRELLERAARGEEDHRLTPGSRKRALLARALAEEVQISPELLAECARVVVRGHLDADIVRRIYAGRYGSSFEAITTESFLRSDSDLLMAGGVLGILHCDKHGWLGRAFSPEVESQMCDCVDSSDDTGRAIGALAVMYLAFEIWRPQAKVSHDSPKTDARSFLGIANRLTAMLSEESIRVAFAAAWALAWVGHVRPSIGSEIPGLLLKLADLWQRTSIPEVRYVAAWAINSLGAVPRESEPFGKPTPDKLALIVGVQQLEGKGWQSDTQRLAALVIAYYLQAPYSETELARLFGHNVKGPKNLHRTSIGQHVDDVAKRLPKVEEDLQISLELPDDLPDGAELAEIESDEIGDLT